MINIIALLEHQKLAQNLVRKSSSESSESVVCQSNVISLVGENSLVSFAVILLAVRLK